MLDHFLQVIVAFERSEPKDPNKKAHRAEEMVAQKLFKVFRGINFRQLADLAVVKGSIEVDGDKDELHLKW